MKLFKKIIQFIIALNLIAIGVGLYIRADIGIGSWDVLHNNLSEFYNLTFGTWVFIVGIITILISQLFYFHLRSFLAVITGFILGRLIDIWSIHIFSFDISSLVVRVPLFFLSIILLGSGISLLVLSKLPPTAPDILMISLMKKFKLNFLTAKTLTETTVFIVAISIGTFHGKPLNNIGIGTLLTLLLIGSIVQVSSKFWEKVT
ncbi:hypothetical protein KHQ81_05425 [Mycoplasmatota bacterium]|nr:hypothetical protein KHQ81_05425 [Mycoplasmatota bacterium]